MTWTKQQGIAAAKRALARKRYLAFVRHCWRQSSNPLLVGRHTQGIAARLDKALEDYRAGKSTYLIVTVPYRHGKSDLVSRYFPPYVLGQLPDVEVILATYGASLSEELSRDARSILSSQDYRALFPKSKLSASARASDEWRLEEPFLGRVHAAGISGAVTGKGAAVLIVDDYLKNREDAESETIRAKQWDSFRNDFMSRLAPVHIVIVCATRWHVKDIIGKILEHNNPEHEDYDPEFPRFEVLHYRARETDPATGEQSYLFEAAADGGPGRFPRSWYVTQFALQGTYGSASLLQGEPTVRGGKILKVDQIQFVDQMPEGLMWVRFWDLASTEQERAKDDPDWTRGARVAVKEIDGVPWLFVDDLVGCREEALARNQLIEATARRDGPAVWQAVESVAGYKDTYTTMASILDGVSVVHKATVSGDKVVRAGEMEPVFAAGHVVFRRGGWNQSAIQELGDFPSGGHDDQVDAISGGYAVALKRLAEAGQLGGGLGKGAC